MVVTVQATWDRARGHRGWLLLSSDGRLFPTSNGFHEIDRERVVQMPPTARENTPQEETDERRVAGGSATLLGAYLLAIALGALYIVFCLWPTITDSAGDTARSLLWCGRLSGEQPMILLIFAAGALGASIHALRSFFWYVGQRNLRANWIAMYLFLPIIGGALAVVFFIVFRGGLLSSEIALSQLNPVGFAALGVIVGMFSQQAILKLKDVANTLFTKPGEGKNASPQPTAGDEKDEENTDEAKAKKQKRGK